MVHIIFVCLTLMTIGSCMMDSKSILFESSDLLHLKIAEHNTGSQGRAIENICSEVLSFFY